MLSIPIRWIPVQDKNFLEETLMFKQKTTTDIGIAFTVLVIIKVLS
jgi:hypothetical protein